MKAFIAACIVFLLMLGTAVTNDVYCHNVCESIERNVCEGSAESAAKALSVFRKNELLLKLSVDNGYVSEASVSLESLIAAHECNDEYEIKRYTRDTALRVERVRRSLFI